MQTQPFTVISKFVVSTTPIWVYILSIIVGILALILITYALHRVSQAHKSFAVCVVVQINKMFVCLEFFSVWFLQTWQT